MDQRLHLVHKVILSWKDIIIIVHLRIIIILLLWVPFTILMIILKNKYEVFLSF